MDKAKYGYINHHQEILAPDKFVEKYSLPNPIEEAEFTESEVETLTTITTIFKGTTTT